MSKLLYANFSRLKKDIIFKIVMAVMFLLGVIICISNYMDIVRYDDIVKFDNIFFGSIGYIGVLIAAFSSMFVGTEYSDGIIRNKIVIGHRRSDIYLSNFWVCTLAGVLSNLCYTLVVCIIGIPLFGFLETSFSMLLVLYIDCILLIVAYSAIFNLVAMLISNKAHATIISMLLIFVALITAAIIIGMLAAPEFISPVTITVDGQMVDNSVPNPRYLTGIKRNIIQTIQDILPTGQSLQIAGINVKNPGWMAMYSVIIASLINVIGIFCFRRKNLK